MCDCGQDTASASLNSHNYKMQLQGGVKTEKKECAIFLLNAHIFIMTIFESVYNLKIDDEMITGFDSS